MPVRQIRRPNSRPTGRFPSLKLSRMVDFESFVELDCIHLLEYEQWVERYEEQPLTIEYWFNDIYHSYTPDFHIVSGGRDWLIECKPDTFVGTATNQRKFSAALAWCQARGWEFRVATSAKMRSGWRLRNVKTLLGYARLEVSPLIHGRILPILLEREELSVRQLVHEMNQEGEGGEVTSTVYCLAFHHQLSIPVDGEPISPDSRVALGNGPADDPSAGSWLSNVTDAGVMVPEIVQEVRRR